MRVTFSLAVTQLVVQEPEQELISEAVDEGFTAVTQYDYEAAEGNEVSFVEVEHIEGIIQADITWWFGTSVDNTGSGYFPAQHVVLVEEPKSEFESHHEPGPYITLIREPEQEFESGTEAV